MPKTTFVRKPCTLDDVREGAEWIENRHGGERIDSYYIAKEVQLEENEFFALHEDLLAERDWVREFSNQDHPMKDGAVPAIRPMIPHASYYNGIHSAYTKLGLCSEIERVLEPALQRSIERDRRRHR